MRNALSISKEGWEKVLITCPTNIVKGMKKACIDADIIPSELFITLLNMVASGDIKLSANPKCKSVTPASYLKVVEIEGDFDIARVRLSTLDGTPINTTPFSNKDL